MDDAYFFKCSIKVPGKVQGHIRYDLCIDNGNPEHINAAVDTILRLYEDLLDLQNGGTLPYQYDGSIRHASLSKDLKAREEE